MFCTQCGQPLSEGSRYCGACGTPVTAPASRWPPAVPGVPPPPGATPPHEPLQGEAQGDPLVGETVAGYPPPQPPPAVLPAVPPTVGVFSMPPQHAAVPLSPAGGPVAGGGYPQEFPAFAPAPQYAGFWRRFWALFIDRVAMSIVLVPLGLVFGLNMLWPFSHDGELTSERLMSIVFGSLSMWLIRSFVEWVYFCAFQSSRRQATPGQLLFGIRVTGLDGRRIGYARASGRYLASWLSVAVLMIGFIMAVFTERKQTLHDMIASTLVVRGGAEPA